MAQPDVAATNGQHGRGKRRQVDGTLLVVGNLRPYLYHVLVEVGLVVQIDGDGVDGVLHGDGCHHISLARVLPLFVTLRHQGSGKVSVHMLHGKGCLSRGVQSVGGIGLHTSHLCGLLQVLQFLRTEFGTIIHIFGLLILLDIQYQAGVLGLYNHLLSLHDSGRQTEQGEHDERYQAVVDFHHRCSLQYVQHLVDDFVNLGSRT